MEGKVHLAGHRVYIRPFANRTHEPNVEARITQELVSSLQRTSKIEVVSKDEAEYVVSGSVVGYSKEVVALDSSGDVSVYRLTITVNLTVADRAGKVVGDFKGIQDYEDYRVYDEIERTKAEEHRAVERIAREIAQRIAVLLL